MAIQFYENKDMLIKCPLCNNVLVVADKRDPNKNRIKCRLCNKLIYYTPSTNERIAKQMPERKSSSGLTFY